MIVNLLLLLHLVYPMDICVLNPFFYPYAGGTEKVLLEVYRRLAKKHNITVLTSAPPGSKKDTVGEVEGIKVIGLKSEHVLVPAAPLPFVVMDGLVGAVKKAGCEMYHINNRYQYFDDCVKAVREVRGKLALTVHNALPIGIDPLVDTLGLAYDVAWGRRLMHEVDLITGISKNTIETTVPKKDMAKTHLVYNGVDYRMFKPVGKNNREVNRIMVGLGETCCANDANVVTNGRLVEQKGQIYLIRALAELAKEGYDIGLLIVGRGPLEKALTSAAQDAGLGDRFWIRNGIPEGQLPYYYNVGDFFVLPSLYEPAGLAVLEAMSCAIPAIASDVGGIPEMLDRYGMYVKPKSTKEIGERLSYMLENKKKVAAIARRGREFAIRRYDWDKIAKRYEELFLNTLHY